ncbi:MAG: heparan-alpha-glucosaminide N-acetyltransferase domain-containing protein [Dysgonamonadaceae bacterium]|nr:heparan-alpha-glucosaminide N-acetyltransferase domain-containing protein [Dysgonamonadaceae bacterium]
MNQTAKLLTKSKQRFLSLDVLRGIAIASMILVNTPGDWGIRYGPLKHAVWHGFTITDLIFPAFLFVVGNAMSFSMKKFSFLSEKEFFKKSFSRFFKIFIIGLLLHSFPLLLRKGGELALNDMLNVGLTGVLQRISITYLISAFIIRYFELRSVVFITAFVLLGYWGVMWFFGDPNLQYTPEGNAILKLDAIVFQFKTHTGSRVRFDSEGLLSNLPAMVNVLFGYLTGRFVQKSGNSITTVWKLAVAGLIFIIAGQIWGIWFPINKALWTSSYVLYTTGLILILLSFLIWILEIMKLKKWSYPFETFGKNPLFIYIVSDALQTLLYAIPVKDTELQYVIYNSLFSSWLNPYNASLFFAICYVALMWLISYWLDKRKIYIKV